MFGKLLKRLLGRAAKPRPSVNSSRRTGWYFRGMGEWWRPFTMKNLINKTDNFPRTAVMALDLDDQQISEINRLAKTAYLWIDSSEMTSKVTESVQGLPDLHEIELHGHQITDDSLRELASLKSLNEVRIVNTSCTEEGIQRLLESLPKCSPGPDPSQFHYGIRIRTVKNEPGSSVEKFYELTPEGTLVHHE